MPEACILIHAAWVCKRSLAYTNHPTRSLSYGGAMRAVSPGVETVEHNRRDAFHYACPFQHRSLWRLSGYLFLLV
jgi:hypothetical protein